ncbi:MAG TPA: membrane protein insertase YidC [Dongiaceae bacterium]
MENNRNMWLFMGISAGIILLFWVVLPRFFPTYFTSPEMMSSNPPPASNGGAGTNGQPAAPAVPAAVEFKARPEALSADPRIVINSDRLMGSISLVGGRVDDLTLANYRETVEPNSPQIVLLNPPGTKNAYYADFGWLADDGSKLKLPGPDTRWTATNETLTPDHPVILTWDNGEGLTFTRSFQLDRNFMFTVTDSVKNTGSASIQIYPYGRIRRVGTPLSTGSLYLHEGPLGVFNGTLHDSDSYSSVKKAPVDYASTGGWLGITDKYWLVALAPDQAMAIKATFEHQTENAEDVYLTKFISANAVALAAGASTSVTTHLFAGAKEVHLLADYRDKLGLPLFDRAVDFGTYFYILTKPMFYVLDFFYRIIGNFGLAILALTICVRLLLFPLANKSFRAMNKMKKLTPLMTELRERYKDDKQKLNQGMMELYKREKVNPAAGCLPIFVQIPVFICLYKTLFVTIEMRHAPFFGWIKDLSERDPTTWINGFGLFPWHLPPELAHIPVVGGILAAVTGLGVWPILMGITMFLQQKMNPPPPDPMQAKLFMLLPIIFTFTLSQFPAGLVIYWSWNNLLSISQQRMLMWRMNRQP